jgi:translation elongation factor EF-1alpha
MGLNYSVRYHPQAEPRVKRSGVFSATTDEEAEAFAKNYVRGIAAFDHAVFVIDAVQRC